MQRHQHRRPLGVQAAVDRGIDAVVVGLEDLASPCRALAFGDALVARDRGRL